ncbi:MAG: hypothetical protein HZB56_04040 [Deltaproteobacteria bacterium]|nr:hypothetical protein [Deltaproteobacteria bacterium]
MRFRAHASIARALLAVAWLAPAAARAHQATHEVARGSAIAVRALEDGQGMAGAAWQVFSPSDAARPHQQGLTDTHGWLAFVPDAPGAWRVRVVEEDGHGLDVLVEAGPTAAVPTPRPAGWQRSAVGVVAVAAAFVVLFVTYRRRPRA